LEVTGGLELGQRWFDVAFVDDPEILRLNREFRHTKRPTDVLSFPWAWDEGPSKVRNIFRRELEGFLGDVIISAETARRDASEEGITLDVKLRQLVLHGALHLLGYDHETDNGEMQSLENKLLARLGIDTFERRLAPTKMKRKKQVKAQPPVAAGAKRGLPA